MLSSQACLWSWCLITTVVTLTKTLSDSRCWILWEGQAILKIRSAVASLASWSDSGHVLGEGTSPPFALWRVISLPGAFWRLTFPTLCLEFFISVYWIPSSFPSAVRGYACALPHSAWGLSHSPEAQTFPAAFYFPALVRTPHRPIHTACNCQHSLLPECCPKCSASICCLFPKPLPHFQAFDMPTSLTPVSLSFCYSNLVLLTG